MTVNSRLHKILLHRLWLSICFDIFMKWATTWSRWNMHTYILYNNPHTLYVCVYTQKEGLLLLPAQIEWGDDTANKGEESERKAEAEMTGIVIPVTKHLGRRLNPILKRLGGNNKHSYVCVCVHSIILGLPFCVCWHLSGFAIKVCMFTRTPVNLVADKVSVTPGYARVGLSVFRYPGMRFETSLHLVLHTHIDTCIRIITRAFICFLIFQCPPLTVKCFY